MATRKTREWGILQDGAWDWRRVYHALGLDITSQKIPADEQPNQVIYRGVKVTLLPPREPRIRTTRRFEYYPGADALMDSDTPFTADDIGRYVEETRNIHTAKPRITVECGCGKVVGYGRMCQHAMACDDARNTLSGKPYLCNCIECAQNDRWLQHDDCPWQNSRLARETAERTARSAAWTRQDREPEDNPTEAPSARIWVYSATDLNEVHPLIERIDPATGRSAAGVVGAARFDDLSLALDAAEREKGLDRWVVVEDGDRVFMSVQDSEFVEMTENVDEGSSWRDCLWMLLPEPRYNPDGSAPDLEAHGPVDEESDVPERYKKIFHKRVAEAEAAQGEGRPALLARVKKDLRLPKQNPCTACDENPRDEPEAGDRVTRYKAQGSLRGVEGTVVSLISHPKLNWVVALVHWDNGEKREHPMHVLQLVPRKSTRNPEDFVEDEDGIDPRYVGWDVTEEEPRQNGFKYNQPDYKYYVVNVTQKVIVAGNEYREDAEDVMAEYHSDTDQFKILRFPHRIGLDPDNDRSWELAPVPREVSVRVYDLAQVQAYWGDMPGWNNNVLKPAALLEVHRFVDLPTAIAEAEKFRDINTLVAIDEPGQGMKWIVSAGDSEFTRWSELGEGTWYHLVERLLNG